MVLGAGTFYSIRMDTLGDLVRAARTRNKWTQEELAERMGVDRNWIAGVETDRIQLPSPDRIELIEQHLGITRQEMLRAAGYLGPSTDADQLFAEISRIAALDSLSDRVAALRRLPPPVYALVEAMAVSLVLKSVGRQVDE